MRLCNHRVTNCLIRSKFSLYWRHFCENGNSLHSVIPHGWWCKGNWSHAAERQLYPALPFTMCVWESLSYVKQMKCYAKQLALQPECSGSLFRAIVKRFHKTALKMKSFLSEREIIELIDLFHGLFALSFPSWGAVCWGMSPIARKTVGCLIFPRQLSFQPEQSIVASLQYEFLMQNFIT